MKTTAVLVTLFISVAALASAGRSTPLESCVLTLPVKITGDFGLEIAAHRLALRKYGHGSLQLTNKTGRTIRRLVIVLDYFDSEGHDIFAIPYFGAPDSSPDQVMHIRPFIKTSLNQPVKPNDKFVLSGSNLEFARIAPVGAEVTFADVEFQDGTNTLLSVSGTHIDPILLQTPDVFEVSSDPKIVPDDLFVVITIDDRGRVIAAAPAQPERVPDSFFDQVRAQLLRWSFFPATSNGGAIEARLNLRLDFRSDSLPPPAIVCPPHFPDGFPNTFVEVDLRTAEPGRWQIQYGGYHVRGKFPTISSTDLPN